MKFSPLLLFLFLTHFTHADYWIRKSDFNSNRGGAVSFVIGGKGYVGTGRNGIAATFFHDLWMYDPGTDAWTQVASLPGAERWYGFGFAIGNYGYVGGGIVLSGTGKEFYEYDALLNSWNQKADLPDSRYDAVAFAIGNKGFLGTGLNGPATHDFWEYDQSSDTWSRKADFPGGDRCRAFGFSINGKGYLGGGNDSQSNLRKDFYEYDPLTDSWSARADFGGNAITSACSFELNGRGYVGPGLDSMSLTTQLWKYDPATDEWKQKTSFVGTPALHTSAFSIGNRAYICLGDTSISGTGSTYSTNTHWEYVPDSLDGIDELSYDSILTAEYLHSSQLLVLHSTRTISICVFNEEGKVIKEFILKPEGQSFSLGSWAAGIYFVTASAKNMSVTKKIIKY